MNKTLIKITENDEKLCVLIPKKSLRMQKTVHILWKLSVRQRI